MTGFAPPSLEGSDTVDGRPAAEPRKRRRPILGRIRTAARIVTRAGLRNSELGRLVVALAIGIAVAGAVILVRELVLQLQHLSFGVPFETHLSGELGLEWWRVLAVTSGGGLICGLAALAWRHFRPGDVVDAIEANALYGGRVSLLDSIRLASLTVLSGASGASVGLEAAYTQLGSGIASRLGRILRFRRADLRILVGCGAAAAIAAAFNAPLAGAFYAFELIIGSYTLSALAPVAVSALTSTVLCRIVFGGDPIFVIYDRIDLWLTDYLLLVLLGIGAAGLGIAAMVGVTLVEGWFRDLKLPGWLRPAIGGLGVGGLALVYPQVLGSGHGGILSVMTGSFGLPLLLALIAAKLAASALSIGSGFRGGMFSSSLFLGVLYGDAFATLVHYVPGATADKTIFLVAGMGAVAAAIVGAPVTMILLMLEATADFSATIGVTVAVTIAGFVVRYWFGYSFATWRFHLRGVPLRGAHDVGWLQDLTVARVMRKDFATVPRTESLRELRKRFPLGGTKVAFAVDEQGRYAGTIDTLEAHSADLDSQCDTLTAGELAHGADNFLLPHEPVRAALNLFLAATAETLAVVDDPGQRRVLGYLTESYALRRYNQELEARRREELGDDEIFSPAASVKS